VIISPLIALQKDQVDSIADQNSADAAAVNSTQRISEIRDRLARAGEGKIEYLFLAPEQLRKAETIENLQRAEVSLFVVDEAHCISEWGHDFRPDYLRLGHVVEALGHPRVLALTATATARVREEIVSRLKMKRPRIFVQGFDRPNIHLRVDHFKTEAEKRDALVHRVRWADKPGIVYTGTRNSAEEIMRALEAEQIEALFYHGGLKGTERHEIQDRFMAGEADVIVATNAFGMGVDKPDIRFVYHYDPSDSLDSYYQEIGRAGRDGEPAEAILFFRDEDIGAQSFKTAEGNIESGVLERLVTHLANEDEPVHPDEVAEEIGLSQRKLTSALHRLEDAGAAEILPTGEVRAVETVDPAEAARAAAEQQELRKQANRDRLQKMRAYADTTGCRRELLLRYLGDEFAGPCNACDNCEAASGHLAVDPSVGTRREVV
jgi:ATP-dependent DNA helicase RecQ